MLFRSFALMWALPAFGQQWCNSCADDCVAPNIVTSVGARGSGVPHFACFNFDTEGVGPPADSNPIDVTKGSSALFCLNPSNDQDGPDVSTVWIRRCLGLVTATDNNCPRILDAVLDGTVGASGTQNSCVRVGSGRYYVEVIATSGDQPYVSLEGEQPE